MLLSIVLFERISPKSWARPKIEKLLEVLLMASNVCVTHSSLPASVLGVMD